VTAPLIERGGKSELQRARCRVTPGVPIHEGRNTERATETRPPMAFHYWKDQARVKRWGKSPPDPEATLGAGNPHLEQGQTGEERDWPDPKNPRVGRLTLMVTSGQDKWSPPIIFDGYRTRLTGSLHPRQDLL